MHICKKKRAWNNGTIKSFYINMKQIITTKLDKIMNPQVGNLTSMSLQEDDINFFFQHIIFPFIQ